MKTMSQSTFKFRVVLYELISAPSQTLHLPDSNRRRRR
jgi:hypothetical protein